MEAESQPRIITTDNVNIEPPSRTNVHWITVHTHPNNQVKKLQHLLKKSENCYRLKQRS